MLVERCAPVEVQGIDSFWQIVQTGPGVASRVAAMQPGDVDLLKKRLRARLTPDADGHVTCDALANAIKGRVAESRSAGGEPSRGRQAQRSSTQACRIRAQRSLRSGS